MREAFWKVAVMYTFWNKASGIYRKAKPIKLLKIYSEQTHKQYSDNNNDKTELLVDTIVSMTVGNICSILNITIARDRGWWLSYHFSPTLALVDTLTGGGALYNGSREISNISSKIYL